MHYAYRKGSLNLSGYRFSSGGMVSSETAWQIMNKAKQLRKKQPLLGPADQSNLILTLTKKNLRPDNFQLSLGLIAINQQKNFERVQHVSTQSMNLIAGLIQIYFQQWQELVKIQILMMMMMMMFPGDFPLELGQSRYTADQDPVIKVLWGH